jgi:hypothetical protein
MHEERRRSVARSFEQGIANCTYSAHRLMRRAALVKDLD